MAVSWDPVDGATSLTLVQNGPASISYGLASPSGFRVDENLTNGQTYRYRLVARFGQETVQSREISATPAAGVTACVTLAATEVTDSSLVVNGLVLNPPGRTTAVSFDVGPTSAYGASTPSSTAASSGVSRFSYAVGPLPDGAEHHHRIVAQNVDGTCTGGDRAARTLRAPEVLASGLAAPFGLTLGAESVYWAERDGNRIARIAKIGGAVDTVAVLEAPTALTGDDTVLYAAGATGIHRVDLPGGASTQLSSGYGGGSDLGLRAAGASLYWRGSGGWIWTVPIAGGTPSSFVPRSATAFDVSGGVLYWTEYLGSLWTMPLVQGAVSTALVSSVCGAVAAGGWVYSGGADAILRVPAGGGLPERIADATVGPGAPAWPAAADATHLYWVDALGALIRKVPLAGGPVTTLAAGAGLGFYSGEGGPLAVDGTHVYWIRRSAENPETGAVVRIPKG